ncbi:MAG: PQQ-binding-like beta-propeller repeat protein [Acidobacteria bacterium]|nr:PQQ-binding-like beta-propeller repeat protein [Acidobacteriota bacterium]
MPDAPITVSVGAVEISTYNPVTITGLERDTSLYFDLRNTGLAPVTVKLPDPKQVQHPFSEHLFALKADEIRLGPGEMQTAEYMLSNERSGSATLEFRFELVETKQQTTVRIEASSLDTPQWHNLVKTATVTGTITSGREPIADAEVTVYPYNGPDVRPPFRARTDSSGRYSIDIPAVDEIIDAMGSRRFPYRSRDYFLNVEKSGHSLGYADGIAPSRGETVEKDLTLSPVETPSYELVKEISTNGPHGYWWVQPNEGFTRFVAVQARHPPELNQPGHVIMFDNSGTVLWQRETLNECWGLHYQNQRVAAGCHDEFVYVLDSSGNLMSQVSARQMNREVELNTNASRLFTGPVNFQDAALLDSSTGQTLWTFRGPREFLRNSRFNASGQRIIAGFGWGALSMLDGSSGRELWRRYIGEFPMFLEFDSRENVYAAGKNRFVFSYDASGNLRWRYRIPNGTALAGLTNLDASGNLLVFGSQRGMHYALDGSGNVRWQRRVPKPATGPSWPGHNALQVTRNGRWIVAGLQGSNMVVLFDSNGSVLWSYTATDRRPAGSYEDNHSGVLAVAVSEDAGTIVAGYADSTIRIFRRK